MKDLVSIINNQAVTSSRMVADKFGKRHEHVIDAIRNLLVTDITVTKMFREDAYEYRGQKFPMFYMNRDGFVLLVMGFKGKKALKWKLEYIAEFNRMENLIYEKGSQMWIEARKTGKLTRRSETDTIKKLVEYAKSQGSKHADMLYMTYSKLANKTADVFDRDKANVKELNTLDEVETMILKVIQIGMADGKQYKEIYQDCKQRLILWQTCTFRLEDKHE